MANPLSTCADRNHPEPDFTGYTLTRDSFYWFKFGITNIDIFFENVSTFKTKRFGILCKMLKRL